MPLCMLLVFGFTLFLSAGLLFLVQLMVGKLLLPYLGGTPAVWNTCMVFFQAMLLAGYAYAHGLPRLLRPRRQVLVHVLLLLAALAPLLLVHFQVGTIAGRFPPPTDTDPIPWLLMVLVLLIGLPFFVISTSAPLLQKWFAGTDHPDARDPYFLYGASNLGSMLGLLGYPTLIEPSLHLTSQAWLWTSGYVLLAGLTVVCGLLALRHQRPTTEERVEPAGGEVHPPQGPQQVPGPWTYLRWVLLAFVPSSMMLGVTTHLTTDIAAVPLLWTLPLAVYLLTFILVFSRLPVGVSLAVVLLLPVALVGVYLGGKVQPTPEEGFLTQLMSEPIRVRYLELVAVALLALLVYFFFRSPEKIHEGMLMLLPVTVLAIALEGDLQQTLGLKPFEMIFLHLGALFVIAMVCHGELARTRPPTSHLTTFYLLMSLGGVLGGMFNTLLAPQLFDRIWEYPLVMVLACILMPRFRTREETTPEEGEELALERATRGVAVTLQTVLFLFGLLMAGFFLGRSFLSADRAWAYVERLPASVQPVARWWAAHMVETDSSALLYRERNFFGYFTVYAYADTRREEVEILHAMYHGTTTHGIQSIEPKEWREQALTYFHPTGPIGQLFHAVGQRAGPQKVAVLGVGTGTLASYMKPGWELTLYEIDPAVVKVATDPDYFTYIPDARERGVKVDVILGDGRQQLLRAPEGQFDVLFMDAFTSDAVPVHLITREALQMYLTRLKPDGLLVINIANRYLDFNPVLGNLAESLELAGYSCSGPEDLMIHRYGSYWVVMARGKRPLESLLASEPTEGAPAWEPLTTDPAVGLWTDDYSNLLRVFKWYR